MIKAKKYNVEDSNIALIGSDLDKKCREAAAEKEPAWEKAGSTPGVEVWRIEKFHVKSWQKNRYGEFYDGDSYIVLKTYKKPETEALAWDVFFWLGENTTQDEAGTAAYKTVELDDKLGGAPVQHREVQDHESELFLKCFAKPIHILSGGVESGFNHVKPEEYAPRLLHIKGRQKTRVKQVERTHKSLNSGDVFVLDMGLRIYQFNGQKSSPKERMKGAQLSRALDDERNGGAQITVFDESGGDLDLFFKELGDHGPIQTAEEAGSDFDNEEKMGVKRLYRLSDHSGSLKFAEVAEGNVPRKHLDSSDVFIFDVGLEVFVWIGSRASVEEKSKSLIFAEKYLKEYNRPPYVPISRILEGGENEVFEACFD